MNVEELSVKVERLERRVDAFEIQFEHVTTKLKGRISFLEEYMVYASGILNVDDVATLMDLKPYTIYKLTRAGRIPFHKPTNGKLKFLIDELIEWLRDDLDPEGIKRLVEKKEKKFLEALEKEEKEKNFLT